MSDTPKERCWVCNGSGWGPDGRSKGCPLCDGTGLIPATIWPKKRHKAWHLVKRWFWGL